MAAPASPTSSPPVPAEDVARVREVLARELETINAYEAHAHAAHTPELREFFRHLAEEEKEHVSEAMMLLRKLDAGQDAHFERGVPEGHFADDSGEAKPPEVAGRVGELKGAPVQLDPRKVVYALEAPPVAHASPLTVGSLRRSRSR